MIRFNFCKAMYVSNPNLEKGYLGRIFFITKLGTCSFMILESDLIGICLFPYHISDGAYYE